MSKEHLPPIDLEQASLLKASGMTFAQVAKVLSVESDRLRSLFSRKGIGKRLKEARHKSAQSSLERVTKAVEVAEDPTNQYKRNASQAILRITGNLAAQETSDPKAMAGQAVTLKTVNDIAKTIYGLERDQAPQFVFNMSSLSDPDFDEEN